MNELCPCVPKGKPPSVHYLTMEKGIIAGKHGLCCAGDLILSSGGLKCMNCGWKSADGD